MEKKYYDLIVSLIKNHRKFPGLESILDELVNDVYEHAKSVLESVTDEGIITSYICKIVTTSLITVPKKLNINTRVSKTADIQDKNEPVSAVETKEVDTNPLVSEETETETETEDSFNENPDNITDNELIESNNDISDILASETSDNIENPDNTEELVKLTNTENNISDFQEVDRDLVDKMINGVPLQEDNDFIEQIDSTEYHEEEELKSDYDSLEEIEIIEDIQEDINSNTEELTTLDIAIEEPDVIDNFIENSSDADLLPEETGISNENKILQEELTDDNETILQNFDNDIEINEELMTEETLIVAETEANTIQNPYERFDYTPDIEEQEFDSDYVYKQIIDFNQKNPEKQILTICDLKYTKKYSVKQISEELNISIEDVIDILYEIIDIVKD